MTKYILIFLFLTSSCYGAELLINNREGHKGEIICVRVDGHNWSDSEKPRVIKLKDVKYNDAVKYEQAYYKDKEVVIDGKTEVRPEMVYERRYKIPDTYFTGTKLSASIGSFSVSKITADIIDKTK